MLQYGTGRYGGYAAPYTPFRRNRVAIAYRIANFYLHSVSTVVLRLTLCAVRLFPTEIR